MNRRADMLGAWIAELAEFDQRLAGVDLVVAAAKTRREFLAAKRAAVVVALRAAEQTLGEDLIGGAVEC